MMEPQIQYVRSRDGTTIAFYDIGEGTPLVISPNLWSHLAASWMGDGREAALRLIKEGFRLIRYDMRGMGLSERDVEDFSLDAQVADLEAIADHLGLERFVLYAIVHGTPPSIMYAAHHPDRLTHLILSVPFADGDAWYRRTPTLQGLESFRAMGDDQWKLYIKTHATALAGMLNMGDADNMADYMMKSASPTSLSRYLAALRGIDVTRVLQDVSTATLAFNTGTELDVPFSRRVVAGIPGARLVPVERAASPFVVPSPHQVPEIVRFVLRRDPLPQSRPHAEQGSAQGTAIILFADIADSTALTEALGDATFRKHARDLDDALRSTITSNGGTPIDGKLLGDGVLAIFPAASQAIAGTLACERACENTPLKLHLGIHAGDVIREANNVYGGAVNIAARVCGLSAPGEILVSATVRELARTSAGVEFEDRGEQEMKGVGEPVRIYAVRGSGAR